MGVDPDCIHYAHVAIHAARLFLSILMEEYCQTIAKVSYK